MKEILMDNRMPFHSFEFNKFCLNWGIRKRFRVANRGSCNGIVKINNWTIKKIVKRVVYHWRT